MGLQIQNGGNGDTWKINDSGQGLVLAESQSMAFHQSFHHGYTFTLMQVPATVTTQNTEIVLSHIQNTSKDKYLCIDKIHVTSLDGATGLVRIYGACLLYTSPSPRD